ncbi:MAG: kelch repeat-containing protein [Verrucomicrobiota bacterium]
MFVARFMTPQRASGQQTVTRHCLPLLFAIATAGLCLLPPRAALAEVPGLLNFQGRIAVRGAPFDGIGLFKLALVNTDGSTVYWRNSDDSNADGEPDAAVSLTVSGGLYSVALGDTALANMAALPASVFSNSAVYLRIWFNDGVTGFQRLSPDQRIAAVGYAMMAANVSDGTITREKLAPDLANQLNSFTIVSNDAQDPGLVARGFQVFTTIAPPPWSNGASKDAPLPRSGHTVVWSGQELLVWGGDIGPGTPSASGSAYQPTTDQWRVLSPLNAPASRTQHSAVWTGTEMIIWGGISASGYVNTGGRFNPSSQNWSALPTTGAPSGRQGNVAVWTGAHMLIWGGTDSSGLLADGALFNPTTGQWTALSAANVPSARAGATAVWTGDRLIIWGGHGASGPLDTGAQLVFHGEVPQASWQSIATLRAPSATHAHTAIWTGQKMIVWGGKNGGSFFNDGAVYDPVTNEWSPISSENAPAARANHNAVWTGAEMIVLNGENASGALATGAAYSPAANKWRPLANPGLPMARSATSAVWTGLEILIFGGQAEGQPLSALQRLNPQPAWHFFRKP